MQVHSSMKIESQEDRMDKAAFDILVLISQGIEYRSRITVKWVELGVRIMVGHRIGKSSRQRGHVQFGKHEKVAS